VCRTPYNRIGFGYDTKNILDFDALSLSTADPAALAAAMIAFGSGDPTKIICSALIAQAFDGRALPDIAQDHARRLQAGPARNPAHPRFIALHAARFRHLAHISKSSNHASCKASTTRPCTGRQEKRSRGAGQFGVFTSDQAAAVVPEELTKRRRFRLKK